MSLRMPGDPAPPKADTFDVLFCLYQSGSLSVETILDILDVSQEDLEGAVLEMAPFSYVKSVGVEDTMREWIGEHPVEVREVAQGFAVWLEDRLLALDDSYGGALLKAEKHLQDAAASDIETVLAQEQIDAQQSAVRQNRSEERREHRRRQEEWEEWRRIWFNEDEILEMDLGGEPRSRDVGLVALREMARRDYWAYLSTEHWQRTREAMFQRHGRQCNRCPATTRLQIHHNTYERLGCEWLEDLEVLCDACHRAHHGIG